MASIKDLGNGKYRVFACNGFRSDGKVNRITKVIKAKSLKDAERQANEIEVHFKDGVIRSKKEEKAEKARQDSQIISFVDLVEKWRELVESKKQEKSKERDEELLKHFMLPYFGDMKVKDIKALQIEEYLSTLEKDGVRLDKKKGGYSEKTILNHYALLHSLLENAVKWEVIEYSPCSKVNRPKVHHKEARVYDENDISKLLNCLDLECEETISKFSRKYDKYTPYEAFRRKQIRIFNDKMHKVYVWVALASACRRSELIGLTVDNVDIANNCIIIKRTGKYTSSKGIHFTEYLKNGSSSKVVDMPVPVMKLMGEYLQDRKDLFNLMGWEDNGDVFISLENGTVTRAGGTMLPDVISTWFDRFIKKYELPPLTLHGLRHTSISYLINRGVETSLIANRAGHQNTRTTEEIYGHIFAKTKRSTADKYDELFAAHMEE